MMESDCAGDAIAAGVTASASTSFKNIERFIIASSGWLQPRISTEPTLRVPWIKGGLAKIVAMAYGREKLTGGASVHVL